MEAGAKAIDKLHPCWRGVVRSGGNVVLLSSEDW